MNLVLDQNQVDGPKAVAVAKDVLKRLRYMKNVIKGWYCYSSSVEGLTGNAQPLVPKLEKECNVCAMGACLLSYIRLYNNIQIDDLTSNTFSGDHCICIDDRFIINKLEDVFSRENLRLIEREFENPEIYYNLDDPKKRLRLIMLNVVKNNGKFDPQPEDLKFKVSHVRLN